jgi:predicted dehydrogenase
MEPVRFGLVGVGGYAQAYDSAIQVMEKEGLGRLASVVIRNREKYAQRVAQLEAQGVPIRASLAEMIEKDGPRLDLIGIPTGINNHHTLLVEAANAGFNVVLEKPPTSTIQYMDAMLAALKRNGTWCQIGFQSQSKTTTRGLKRLICDGRLGRIREVVVRGVWVRTDKYYARNPWAGRFREGDVYVLDGTVNNPLAHYLMNGLYFASTQWGRIASPTRVRGELYKGHRIESEDTSAVEVQTAEGARVYFLATLCGEQPADHTVYTEVVGEKGTAQWRSVGEVTIQYRDGSTETVADPGDSGRDDLFRNAVRYLRGVDKELNCPLEMTRPFVLAMNGAFLSSGTTRKVSDACLKEYMDDKGEKHTEIVGVNQFVLRGYQERRLYSDLGAPWAVPTKPVDVTGLKEFRMATPSLD